MAVAKRKDTAVARRKDTVTAKSEKPVAGPKRATPLGAWRNRRRSEILETARREGLLAGVNNRIAARIRKPLIDAAKARSGIKSDTELLEYALACVALEDDFVRTLFALEGSIPQDINLEY
jgi:hypothetical protein